MRSCGVLKLRQPGLEMALKNGHLNDRPVVDRIAYIYISYVSHVYFIYHIFNIRSC